MLHTFTVTVHCITGHTHTKNKHSFHFLPHSGTKEIYVDVDDDGVISMIFECSEMSEGSEFIWSKNYQAITDTSRLTIVQEKGRFV